MSIVLSPSNGSRVPSPLEGEAYDAPQADRKVRGSLDIAQQALLLGEVEPPKTFLPLDGGGLKVGVNPIP
jgi:hypothetical protein